MARQRNKQLPANVTERKKQLADGKTQTYYAYVFPDGKRKSIGSDLDGAIKIGKALNERTADIRAEKIQQGYLSRRSKILVGNPSFKDVAQAFLRDRGDHLAKLSKANRKLHIDHATKAFGKKPIQSITTYDLAQFLRKRTASAHKAHRGTFNLLWKYAINSGLAFENPVANTELMKQPHRQRHRHTWEGYQAILSQAEPWLYHTMEIALHSVQRRSDLSAMKWTAVDMNRRLIKVKQIKTGTYIAIEMSDALHSAISWFEDSEECPLVVHRRPSVRTKRYRQAVSDGRQHPFEVTPDTLTKAFTNARNRSGYYNHLHPSERPAFHDLRALGMFALEKAGYPITYIQALAGHADTKMTTLYLEGHETKQPEIVAAGDIGNVDWSSINWSTPLPPNLIKILD